MNPSSTVGEYRVQVLDRTFAILNILGESGELLGPSELGRRLKLNKSTVHRLLTVLERHRYVERDLETMKYRLGLKLAELGSFALPHSDPIRGAKPYVEELASRTGEAAHLGILQGTEILSITHAPATNGVSGGSTVGRRSPLHCTSLGKAIVAFHKNPDQLLRAYRFTPLTRRTIRTPLEFKAELQKVRTLGFAVDNEEFQPGLRCIGAPIRDPSGNVVAAISIAGPLTRITGDRSRNLSQSVVAIARDLSLKQGSQDTA